MQTVCNTYRDAGKGNLTVQNTRKLFGGRGSAPWESLQRSRKPLAGGEGLRPPPTEPHPPLSALWASPLLPPLQN